MTLEDNPEPRKQRRIRSYVVRAGRMTAGQDRALKELWPLYGLEYRGEPLLLDRCFGRRAPKMMEIGFGTGDALLEYAEQNPEHDCLGIEVHPPGVGHLLLHVHDKGLKNVRVVCHDAVEVLTHALPADSLDEVHIFFPDPWHKKRHHKRRLIQTPFVDTLARALTNGAVVKLATDSEDYAHQMRSVFDAHACFVNMSADMPLQSNSESLSGFAARPAHRPVTRFERRGHRLGHGVWDLSYYKK